MLGLLKNYNSSFASELIRQSKVAVGPYTQNVVYILYGGVFVEERNGSWVSSYLFNAKELDEETGLYYYGARYLDPTGAMWLSVDPMWEDYRFMTSYSYCAGNPVKIVDPDGTSLVSMAGKRIIKASLKHIADTSLKKNLQHTLGSIYLPCQANGPLSSLTRQLRQ
ncbi:MAG: RHS repeat-associated core domain-containing protein [Paludibacteraceae bacterium]|nr:RHS repeat-associated core domain-containing protein [Paludibacteraceae bacterium]